MAAHKTAVETDQYDHRDQHNPLGQIFIPLVRCQETMPTTSENVAGAPVLPTVHYATLAQLGFSWIQLEVRRLPRSKEGWSLEGSVQVSGQHTSALFSRTRSRTRRTTGERMRLGHGTEYLMN